MVQIAFDVMWAKELSRNLRLTSVNLDNLQPFYSDAIDIVKERSDELFWNAGSNVQKGPKRDPLAPITQRSRENRWWYYKKSPTSWAWPLVWTGNLRDSAQKQATQKYWSLEYTAPYAKYHQSGWWRLPQRKIIDLNESTIQKIVKSLQKTINDVSKIFMKQV